MVNDDRRSCDQNEMTGGTHAILVDCMRLAANSQTYTQRRKGGISQRRDI